MRVKVVVLLRFTVLGFGKLLEEGGFSCEAGCQLKIQEPEQLDSEPLRDADDPEKMD